MKKKNAVVDVRRRQAIVGGVALIGLGTTPLLAGCGASGGQTARTTSSSGSSSGGSSSGSSSSSSGGSSSGSGSTTGYDGVVRVGSGTNAGRLVNGAGNVVQLRGANMSGMEGTAAQGWDANPWADDGGTPDWAVYATWKPNAVRIPLNASSWLGLMCGLTAGSDGAPTWGTVRNADYGANYKSYVIQAVAAAQAIGCYVILDLHWCAPKITLGGVTNYLMPLGQSPFADADTAIPFWTSIAQTFGTQATPAASGINNAGVIFELFNEPYLNSSGATVTTTAGGSTRVDPNVALLQGGWVSQVINYSQQAQSGFPNFRVYQSWQIAGYQAMLDAIRATGAANVCIINGNYYTQDLSAYATYLPKDSLSTPQLACGWHCYEQANANSYTNNNYPYTSSPYYYPGCGAYTAGQANAKALDPANAVIAAGIPVICTEDGGYGGTQASSGEQHFTYMQNWSDSSGASRIVWQWNNTRVYGTTGSINFLTVYASDGKTILPLQGAGQVMKDWMVNHA